MEKWNAKKDAIERLSIIDEEIRRLVNSQKVAASDVEQIKIESIRLGMDIDSLELRKSADAA